MSRVHICSIYVQDRDGRALFMSAFTAGQCHVLEYDRAAIPFITKTRPRVMIASMLNNPNIHGNAKIRQGTIPAIDISNCLLTLCDVPCVSEALRSLLVPSDVSNSTYIMRQCRGHPIELYVSAIRQQRSTNQYSRFQAFNQNDRYT